MDRSPSKDKETESDRQTREDKKSMKGSKKTEEYKSTKGMMHGRGPGRSRGGRGGGRFTSLLNTRKGGDMMDRTHIIMSLQANWRQKSQEIMENKIPTNCMKSRVYMKIKAIKSLLL